MVQQSGQSVPEIVVVIAGGQVQNIISPFSMNVIIADHDTERSDEEGIYSYVKEISRGKAEIVKFIGGRTEAEVNPGEIARISAGLDASNQRVEYLTYDEFCERFKPIQNPIREDAPLDGAMFETFGTEEETVKKALINYPGCVWTLLDGEANDELCRAAGFTKGEDGEWMDGEMSVDFSIIGDGFHHVNRQGYLITEVPAEKNTQYNVYMADELANAAKKGV